MADAVTELRLGNPDATQDASSEAAARRNWQRYVRARDGGHTQWADLAMRCDRAYLGDQWDPNDKRKVEAEGRPALTINTILPTINTVLGEHAVNRADPTFKPADNGDEQTAELLSRLALAIAEDNGYEYAEGEVFADGLICDRGYFDVRVDFDENLMGHIKIEALDPLEVVLSPDAKDYSPEKWPEVFRVRWVSLDDIASMYGQRMADRVRQLGLANQHWGGQDSFRFERASSFGGEFNGQDVTPLLGDPEQERSVRAVRLIERQYVQVAQKLFLVDPHTGDMKPAPGNWEEERALAFAEKMQLIAFRRPARRIRWTVSVDRLTLHDDWSPYPFFTIVPFFPYFRRGRPLGAVRNLLDPQDQHNKISSQELHVVNTTANSGWVVDAGALVGMTADDLREQGSATGLVLEKNPGKVVEKIKPNQIPTGLDRISLKSAMQIREISGVNDAMRGQVSNEASGLALETRRNSGLVQLQVPFANLKRSREMVFRRVLELIQAYYTETRVVTIADRQQPERREQVTVNQPTAAGEVLNDLTVGKYRVVMGTVPARDTFNEVQFQEVAQLRAIGVAIPDDRVIEYSNLVRRHELAEEIRQLTGRAEPSEEELRLIQFERQLMIRERMLGVEKLAAEVKNLEAQAAERLAKAQAAGEDVDLERSKIEAEIQQKREELQTRLELARMDAMNDINLALINSEAARQNTVEQRRGNVATALIQAQSRRIQSQVTKSSGGRNGA